MTEAHKDTHEESVEGGYQGVSVVGVPEYLRLFLDCYGRGEVEQVLAEQKENNPTEKTVDDIIDGLLGVYRRNFDAAQKTLKENIAAIAKLDGELERLSREDKVLDQGERTFIVGLRHRHPDINAYIENLRADIIKMYEQVTALDEQIKNIEQEEQKFLFQIKRWIANLFAKRIGGALYSKQRERARLFGNSASLASHQSELERVLKKEKDAGGSEKLAAKLYEEKKQLADSERRRSAVKVISQSYELAREFLEERKGLDPTRIRRPVPDASWGVEALVNLTFPE